MSSEKPLVLVTGISGFIGSWVAYCALKQGYRVRGTVRSVKNESKVKHLRDLCPGSDHKVELVEADLTSDEGWEEAVKGCQYILHVASPFVIDEPKDKMVLITPAVEGTLRVLRAAAKTSPRPARVVVTSSTASIAYGRDVNAVEPLTDEDWTILDDPTHPEGAYIQVNYRRFCNFFTLLTNCYQSNLYLSYLQSHRLSIYLSLSLSLSLYLSISHSLSLSLSQQSKTLAEKAAWDFVASLPADKRFELATINPTLVLGPMLSGSSCASVDLIRDILTGKVPALPDFMLDCVSVFDVAKAHVLAMTQPEAAGKRFMLHGGQMSMRETAAVLTTEFKPLGYSPTSMHIPAWVLYFASFVDPQAASMYPSLGIVRKLKVKNVNTILKMDLMTDVKAMVIEMAYGGILAGVIPKKELGVGAYVQPQIDLSNVPYAK
jgi:nucleoside-diphosphate-sugar epimerase